MAGLAPDLAGKVLSADMRNLVKKVGDGDVLSDKERELFEKALAEETLPEELQKARTAALLRKWALGGNLSKDQAKEIASHLPDAKAGAQRLTREKYQHTLAHYAEQLVQAGMPGGKHVTRKLKHWIATGREQTPHDLPPFDNLELLEAWWDRNMTWKPPEWVKHFSSGAPEEKQAPPKSITAASVPSQPSPDANAAPSLPKLEEIKIDVDAASDQGVRIFQAVVADTLRRLNEAAKLGSHREYNRLLNDLSDQLESLRKQEAAAMKQAEAKGEALRTRVLTSETVGTFTVLAYSFTNALMTVVEKLAPSMAPADRRSLVIPLRDGIFNHCKKTRYREAWDATKTKLEAEPAWTSLQQAS